MARQLALDLPVRPALGREDFLVAPSNAAAIGMMDAPRLWPQGKLLLIGPAGSGKTHLAHVFARDREAVFLDSRDLPQADNLPPALIVEDAERVAGRQETALFHLHNRQAETGGLLLLTASSPPADWKLNLPDLLSRMQGTAVATLHPPDDTLLAAVLVKLFADRQLKVPPQLIPWMVGRMDRSFAAARELVRALDETALAERGPITRAMAARILDNMGDGTP